jgi:DNA-directed RNA polymerase specialized sigma24 family protein
MADAPETDFARDLELARRCVRREDAAWSELIARFHAILNGIARHQLQRAGLGCTTESARDLSGEFFERLLLNDCRKLEQYQGLGSLEAFLAVIAVRFVRKRITYLRRRAPTVSLDVAAQVSSAAEATVEDADYAAQLIGRLSTDERTLYHLHWVQGAAAEACARALGVTIETFYARKSRMLKRLRVICEADGKVSPVRGL